MELSERSSYQSYNSKEGLFLAFEVSLNWFLAWRNFPDIKNSDLKYEITKIKVIDKNYKTKFVDFEGWDKYPIGEETTLHIKIPNAELCNSRESERFGFRSKPENSDEEYSEKDLYSYYSCIQNGKLYFLPQQMGKIEKRAKAELSEE